MMFFVFGYTLAARLVLFLVSLHLSDKVHLCGMQAFDFVPFPSPPSFIGADTWIVPLCFNWWTQVDISLEEFLAFQEVLQHLPEMEVSDNPTIKRKLSRSEPTEV